MCSLLGCNTITKNDTFQNYSHPNDYTSISDNTTLNLMSFNIRNGRAADGDNHWNKRKNLVFKTISQQLPDVIGIQEAFRFQLDEINNALPEFKEIGEGRAGGNIDEYSAILYREERFILHDSGTFWLSDTPTVVSKSWGNSHIRICTWVHLIDKKSNKAFYVYNTHLDNRSQISREKSVAFIASTILNREHKDPFILMGDFNAGENNKAILYLLNNDKATQRSPIKLKSSYREVHPNTELVGTFNGFKGLNSGPKIDYIFVEPKVKVIDADILMHHENSSYPSDHFPIITKIQLP